jgi:hypothetical protein
LSTKLNARFTLRQGQNRQVRHTTHDRCFQPGFQLNYFG